jgi:arylsulfatase A
MQIQSVGNIGRKEMENMNRRMFLKNLGLGAASFAMLGCELQSQKGACSPKTIQPNVVIFYADDLGWGDIRSHNTNPNHFRYTPTIDRIFNEGIEFKNYMTHCVCSPSRAGLLTGKHYANVGAGPRTGGTLPSDIRNFAKDYKTAGYKTGAFGKWHNGLPNFPAEGNGAEVDYNKDAKWNDLHREKTLNLKNNIFENHKGWKWGQGVNAYGFDRFVGYYNGGGDLFDRYVDWHHDLDWWHDRSYRGDETGYTTDLITKYAIQFIDDCQADPFLCYIPHEAVHSPLQLKCSDLREFCEKLDTELGIKGQWDYMSNIRSPATGRRIADVAELRCEGGADFDVGKIDPKKSHYAPLVYATYLYSLDKSVGEVIQKITDIGKLKETIFFFASDNGAAPAGINIPFRGGKHSLWEGGIHVPAAIWWPGTFDKNTAPYSPCDHSYDGFISYIDIYPTLMSMSGQSCLGTNLDGMDCWANLRKRTECRSDMTDAIYWMWLDYGAVRTRRWKLHYSESTRRIELYDLAGDIEETNNVASANPAQRDQLIGLYRKWIKENNYAMSFMTIDKSNIRHLDPSPSGEVLEVKAIQTKAIKNTDTNGVFVRFSDGAGWEKEYDAYVHPGDRVEFDIYVCDDSEITTGCFYTPGDGWNPFYKTNNGLNQDAVKLVDLVLPKGVWKRQVVGIGNYCPGTLPVNFIALQSTNPGYYHYCLDNIIIRKNDGKIRSVIWSSKSNFAPLLFRYKGVSYNSMVDAKTAPGFPFSDIQIAAVDTVKG